jgi:hypothetical protein
MPVRFEYEADRVSEPVWALWRKGKSVYPDEIQISDFPTRSLITVPTAVLRQKY